MPLFPDHSPQQLLHVQSLLLVHWIGNWTQANCTLPGFAPSPVKGPAGPRRIVTGPFLNGASSRPAAADGKNDLTISPLEACKATTNASAPMHTRV